jgi:spermidine/putrescine transport system substrate-binding protein
MTDRRISAAAGLSRRDLLRRGAAVSFGAGSLGLLSACSDSGGSSSTSSQTSSTGASTTAAAKLTGTIVFLNYPQWIGPKEVKDFEAAHPGVKIKQNTTALTESVSGTAVKIAQNPKAFDMLLGDLPIVGQLMAGGFVADLDPAKIPNLGTVEQRFRTQYPHGVPTDYGKVGFGYRKDMVKERPTSWADFWAMAPKYKNKIVVYNLDRDVLGSALKYLGFSTNTKDKAQLDKARDAIKQIKPYIKAFKAVDIAKELVTGGAALALTGDYDVALAQTQSKNIEWVAPTEGMTGYLEGWIGVKQSEHLPTVEAFANFHLEPQNYASFVNATGTAYVVPGAKHLMKPEIADNPILSSAGLDKVEFIDYVGEDTTKYISKIWNEIQAA